MACSTKGVCNCNCNYCTCNCNYCTCHCNNCTCNSQGASTGLKKTVYGSPSADTREKTTYPNITYGVKVLASLINSMKTALQAELSIRGLPEPGSSCTCNCNYTGCPCNCNHN